jgi:beta-phosphoglucomutase-like phosphatase (HAD superfamily)
VTNAAGTGRATTALVIPCRALLFDLDGLMVDSEPVWFDVQREFVEARGGEWTNELARACIGGGLANSLRVMQQAFGFTVDFDRDTRDMVEAFVSRIDGLEMKAGCRELVDAARGRALPCVVASSSTQRLVESTLSRFGLLPLFDAVVTGECVARPKPAPDIFLEAAARVGAQADSCVVLEDSMAGVRAARAAGMRVIAVPEGDFLPFVSLADAVVGDLRAARALLAL